MILGVGSLNGISLGFDNIGFENFSILHQHIHGVAFEFGCMYPLFIMNFPY